MKTDTCNPTVPLDIAARTSKFLETLPEQIKRAIDQKHFFYSPTSSSTDLPSFDDAHFKDTPDFDDFGWDGDRPD